MYPAPHSDGAPEAIAFVTATIRFARAIQCDLDLVHIVYKGNHFPCVVPTDTSLLPYQRIPIMAKFMITVVAGFRSAEIFPLLPAPWCNRRLLLRILYILPAVFQSPYYSGTHDSLSVIREICPGMTEPFVKKLALLCA